MSIRPVITTAEGIAIRDTIQRVIVFNTLHQEFLLDEEKTILKEFESRLSALLLMAETREKIKSLRSDQA